MSLPYQGHHILLPRLIFRAQNQKNIQHLFMSFSVDRAKVKLAALVPTQQSIQTTSQWIMFHYREASTIVDLWVKEITSQPNKLTLFYLANDIVQLSRKDPRNAGFTEGFKKVLPQVLQQINPGADRPKFVKVLQVWKDRNIYPSDYVNKLMNLVGQQPAQTLAQHKTHQTEPAAYQKCPSELIEAALQYDHLKQISSATSTKFASLSETYQSTLKAENLPEPHILVGQLEGLVKGSEALETSIKNQTELREKLIGSLESLIQVQRDWINLDKTKLEKLDSIKTSAHERKTEIESTLNNVDDDEDLPTYKGDEDDESVPGYNNGDEVPSYGNGDEAQDNDVPAYESPSDFISSFAAESKRPTPEDAEEPSAKRQEIPVNVDLNALLSKLQ
ncbi:hypothetical protein KL909_002855 [Ogataea angusta]|uniref:CID domain-containing protein n=1 Tax=Pichia angusta TaxID=870730 RepID=A0AAN6I4Q7_PICAN|nr:uncharacterized protein KL928_003875 [Ogataea angusta]KAG7817140.1 hypothetical protein KL928_003875 [Ogataea angusta]KAG7823458.1 hypothetical protein KL909_002855 [Ogataea angusta]